MSPPFFNFNRRLPSLEALARLASVPVRPSEPDTRDLGSRCESFLDNFSFATANEPVIPGDRHPEGAIVLAESMARSGDLSEYATVLNFRALQLDVTGDPVEQAAIRARSLTWAEEALGGITAAPGFARDRVRALYDTVLALSAILARDDREALPEAERQLLLRYFIQIRAGIERHRFESEGHPEYPPIPAYFDSYARAEQALLEGHAAAALAAFLETRNHIQDLPGTGTFRNRVEDGTEYAIQAMPRDASGHFLENLRSRSNLDLLLLFAQVDGDPDSELQALSLAALALAEGALRGAGARGILETLRGAPRYNEAEGESILADLERAYTESPEFRRACEDQIEIGAATTPRQICAVLLDQAARAANRILDRDGGEPYATVLRRDSEHRPLREAVEQLQSSPWLRDQIAVLLRLHPATPPRALVQNLIEYGPLAETMLESLPAALRATPFYENFSRAILQVADSENSERQRLRWNQPLEALLDSLETLARDDDRYAPAYAQFFSGLAEAEGELAPGIGLPSGLRTRAAALRDSITEFNGRRLARHVFASESLLSLAGGIALTELMPIGILRFARNGGNWVRAGRVTWQSELAVGLGVGLTMSTVGGIHHLAASPHPVREELPRILPTLALNTLFSSLAMGGTMLAGHGLRRVLLREGTRNHLLLRHLGLRTTTIGIGGGLMLGAEIFSERLSSGHWRRPNAEQIAETYLNMLLWDAGAAGLRRLGGRYWPNAQLGPHLSRAPEGAPPPRPAAEPREVAPPAGPRTQARDEIRTPDRPLPLERRPMDETHNIPFDELQRLWELPMRPLPREILSNPELRPIYRVRAGNQDFYLSRVIETLRYPRDPTPRRYALALVPVEVDGRMVLKRRFFYVSNSDAGAWRSSPFMLGDFHLVKGEGRHYTQETQPVWEIAEALMRLEHRGPPVMRMPLNNLIRYISAQSEALGPEGARTMQAGFREEVDFPSAMGMSDLRAMRAGHAFALPPGWGWGNQANIENTLRQMRSLSWPDGFIPDFLGSPTRAMSQPNSLLGPLVFREFRGAFAIDRASGRHRPLVWIMGEDTQGRAWVRHLHYGDSEVNSYGVYGDILDSGILTSKPLEYLEQSGLLAAPYRRPFNADYADISPALTLLEPIRRYREARGLRPLLSEAETPTTRNPEP